MYEQFGISEKIEKLSIKSEKEVENVFKQIDEICAYNTLKVLKAFQDNHISEIHFGSTTGYGYLRNTCTNSGTICIFKTRRYTS